MQIDWAGLVIKELMDDKNVGQINMEDTPILEPRPSVLTDDVRDPFTELLMFYAEKSLQFPTMIGSQGSVCKYTLSLVPLRSLSLHPQLEVLLPQYPLLPVGLIEFALHQSPPPFLQLLAIVAQGKKETSSSHYSLFHRSGASIFGSIPESAKYSVFEPPPRPPPKEAWETDPRIKNCRICKTVVFGMVRNSFIFLHILLYFISSLIDVSIAGDVGGQCVELAPPIQ